MSSEMGQEVMKALSEHFMKDSTPLPSPPPMTSSIVIQSLVHPNAIEVNGLVESLFSIPRFLEVSGGLKNLEAPSL